MRFEARQPREGINVSKTHPLAEAGALILGLTAIFIAVAVVLVFLVEIALYFVSPDKEADLFRNWLPDDLVTVAPDDDRLQQTQELVDRLTAHWPDAPYEFRVEIDDSELSNAMALPGGLIVVTQGLLDQVESENELAFVLGHELGHFRNRDHLRALGRGIVLSVFVAAISGGDAGGIGINVADLTLRGFGRKQESKADTFGLEIVEAEYGHVDEAWRLFQRWDLEEKTLLQFVTYLSTHPDSGDRVADLEALATENGWRLDGDVTSLDW